MTAGNLFGGNMFPEFRLGNGCRCAANKIFGAAPSLLPVISFVANNPE
jgi:hypothetical protein